MPSNNYSLSPYIIILIVVFLIFIIIIIIWVIILRMKRESISKPQTTNAGYGSRCSIKPIDVPTIYDPQQCSEDLTCVQYDINSNWGICKTSLGQPCNTLNQCVPNAVICLNVCSETYTGGLNQIGPCNPGLIIDSDGLCKYNIGYQGCNKSSDCVYGSCVFDSNLIGTCKPQFDDGTQCNVNSDCLNNNCSGNLIKYCQPPDIISGEINSACSSNINTGPQCGNDLGCFQDFGTSSADFGICRSIVKSWPSTCNNEACIPPTICYNGNCVYPETISKFETNSCSITGVCSKGYTCNNNNCIPDSEVPFISNNWGILKWIGYWEKIATIIRIPTSGTNLTISNNIAIYNSEQGWIGLPLNGQSNYYFINVVITNVDNYLRNIIDIQFTPNSGLLITYSLTPLIGGIAIYKSYLFDVIPPVFNTIPINTYDITFSGSINPYYVNNGGNITQIQGIKWVSIDDRDPNLNRLLYIDLNNILFTGNVSKDYINNPSSNINNLTSRLNNAIWAQFYSYNKLSDPTEFAYKNNQNSIQVSSNGENVDIQIPPTEIFNTSNSPILNQFLYSGVGVNIDQMLLLYFVGYDNIIGGPQIRLLDEAVDNVLPGYFSNDNRIQTSIDNRGIPYIITTIS